MDHDQHFSFKKDPHHHNRFLNMVRVLLLSLNSTLIIITISSAKDIKDVTTSLIVAGAIIFAMTLLMWQIQNYSYSNIFHKHQDPFKQVLYLINLENEKEVEMMLVRIVLEHKGYCDKNSCYLCQKFKDVIQFKSNTKCIRNIFKYYLRDTNHFHERDYKIVTLSLLDYLDRKFFQLFKESIKNQTTSWNTMVNLSLFRRGIAQAFKDCNNKYAEIMEVNRIINTVSICIESIDNYILNDENTLEDSITCGEQLNSLKQIKFTKDMKACYQYECYILEYAIQNLLPDNPNVVTIDIELYEEVLETYFKENRNITILYDIKENESKIIKANYELHAYISRDFKELLIPCLEGYPTFIQKLTKSNLNKENVFEHIIYKDFQVMSFEFTYRVLPSIDGDKLLLNGKYQMDYTSLMIININDDTLVHFTSKVQKFIKINKEWLKVNKINLTFKEIFSESFTAEQEEYTIDYERLNKIYEDKSIEKIRNKIEFDGSLVQNRKIVIEKFQKKSTMTFLIKEFLKDTSNYLILSVHPQNNILMDPHYIKNKSLANDLPNVSIINLDSRSNYESSNSQILVNFQIKNKTKDTNEVGNKFYKNANVWITLMSIINLTVCLYFLILETNLSNDSSMIPNLFNRFRAVGRQYAHSNLNLLANLCLTPKDEFNCTNFFQHYAAKKINQNSSLTKTISDHIKDEFPDKISDLFLYLRNLRETIHEVKDFSSLLTTNIEKVYIDHNNGNLRTYTQNITFDDFVASHVNRMEIIIKEDVYYKTSNASAIYLTSMMDDQFDLSNIKNPNLSQTQIGIYESLFNFIPFHNTFFKLLGIIEDSVYSTQAQTRNICQIFILTLVGLHLITFLFVIYLLKHTKDNLFELHCKLKTILNDRLQVTFLKKKLSILRVICQLHTENPNNLVKKLENTLHDKVKKANSVIENNSNNYQISNMIISYPPAFTNIIWLRLKRGILIIILIYSLHSLLFYLYINTALDDVDGLIYYLNQTSTFENKLFFMNNLLILMPLINLTETKLSDKTYNNNQSNAFRDAISLTIKDNFELPKLEREYPYLFPSLSSYVKINCDSMHRNFRDSLYSRMNKTLSYSIWNVLRNSCKYLQSDRSKNDIVINNEFLYDMIKKLDQLNNHDYDNLIDLATDKLMNDMYVNSVTIIRPIRSFYRNRMIPNLQNGKMEVFQNVVLAYIILSITLEIGIALLINFLVISNLKCLISRIQLLLSSLIK